MKRFIYTLFAVMLVAFAGNAQEPSELAVSKGVDALAKSKGSGEYIFTLPSTVSKEDVEKSSKYYTHYFSVDFKEDAHEATINLVNNEVKSRFVIARFLTSCGVRFITVDGKNVTLDEFSNTYLK